MTETTPGIQSELSDASLQQDDVEGHLSEASIVDASNSDDDDDVEGHLLDANLVDTSISDTNLVDLNVNDAN